MIDPLIFLNKTIDDHRPPIIHSFKTYPQPSKGIFERSAESRIFSFNRETFTAWGKVGFAVRADDYMDDVSNTFGVRFMKLYCDGKLVFASDATVFRQPTTEWLTRGATSNTISTVKFGS